MKSTAEKIELRLPVSLCAQLLKVLAAKNITLDQFVNEAVSEYVHKEMEALRAELDSVREENRLGRLLAAESRAKIASLTDELETVKAERDKLVGSERSAYERFADKSDALTRVKDERDKLRAEIDEVERADDPFHCAPDWANWYAVDYGGRERWFERKPSAPAGSEWIPSGGMAGGRYRIDWRESLRSRPQNPTKPACDRNCDCVGPCKMEGAK